MPDMLDYTIETFFPHISKSLSQQEKYAEFFGEVVERTAHTVALWQCYGFCHGVLNTDNMSILGLTIDYGPFGFMEHFNSRYICNHSDDEGRYCYEAQTAIGLETLQFLADALDPIIPMSKTMQNLEEKYNQAYHRTYDSLMARKFGLTLED